MAEGHSICSVKNLVKWASQKNERPIASFTSEWQANPSWNQETRLESLRNLGNLLNSPPESFQDHLPPNFPNVQGIMNGILQGISEEADQLTKMLGTIHAEYRCDYSSEREYVRIWKCIQVQPYLEKDYSAAPPTQVGEYYEWQKMTTVSIHIRRTFRMGISTPFRTRKYWFRSSEKPMVRLQFFSLRFRRA